MGISNSIILPFYREHIKPSGEVALLGFTNNKIFNGDLYDLELGNFDINSEWTLPKKYDTIICTRCAYFARNPFDLITRCNEHLKDNGRLFIDWSLGDNWRFPFKIGWITKDGNQEFAYRPNNFLWSTVWDDNFLNNTECKKFIEYIKKFGYTDLKKAIEEEVPSILKLSDMETLFNVKYNILAFNNPTVQIYFLIEGVKK